MVRKMISLFEATLFTVSNVGTDEQVKLLLEQIESIKHQDSVSNTNDGCWRSNHKYENIDWLLKEITYKVDEAIDYYKQKDSVFSDLSIKRQNLKIFYWTNINDPGSRNVLHSHKTAVFSGVYYIKATGTGSLRLINPANMLGDCNSASPFTRDFYFDPRDRDLILWPSWIPHEVEVNRSTQPRINIAYDIII